MDIIEEKFPHYDPAGQEMVRKAYEIASRALAEDKRSDGSPFIGHPMGVALICIGRDCPPGRMRRRGFPA